MDGGVHDVSSGGDSSFGRGSLLGTLLRRLTFPTVKTIAAIITMPASIAPTLMPVLEPLLRPEEQFPLSAHELVGVVTELVEEGGRAEDTVGFDAATLTG